MRELTSKSETGVELRLEPGVGLLLVGLDGDQWRCFVGKGEIPNLAEKACEYKFVGAREVFELLAKRLPDLQAKLKRKVEVETVTTIYYYPRQGRVLIPKQIKKKVLVVDDSKTIQRLLREIINSSSEMEVMAVASDPLEAKQIIEKERPDLITLDIHMPHMSGVDFMANYLKHKNIPVVMISSISINESSLVLEALAMGAVDYIQKPTIDSLEKLAPIVTDKLAKIVRETRLVQSIGPTQRVHFASQVGLIAIGASTGGTQALEAILTRFPKDVPPIVCVQHIPAVFSKALAERLNKLCLFEVIEVTDGQLIAPNCCYIAPGDKQFKLRQRGAELVAVVNDDPAVNRFKPSVDYLFHSVARLAHVKRVGVILTGMGKDGAEGLLAMKNSNATTIGQDENSCVVYGMPKEAFRIGAVDQVLALDDIPNALALEFESVRGKVS